MDRSSRLILKRVFVFLGVDLILNPLLFLLLLNILPQGLLLNAYSTHVIPRRLEMPVLKFILQIRVTLENYHRAFPLQIPHKTQHGILWRDRQQQVNMVQHDFSFDDRHAFPLA